MIKNNSLFKNISIFLCLVPMLLLSLFCFVPKKTDLKISALSDEVINNFNFVSSNFAVPSSLTSPASNTYYTPYVTISFGLTDGVYSAVIRASQITNDGAISMVGSIDNILDLEDIVSRDSYIKFSRVSDSNYYTKVLCSHSGQLSSDIVKVEFSSSSNVISTFRDANYYNTVTYYDSQGEFIKFEFSIYSISSAVSNLLFVDRTYYFTTSFSDNTYYQDGYQDGLDQGLQDGYQNGYQSGLDTGSQSGYQDGFSAGVLSANDYSFLGLLGAVIDAPVTALTGLLNFNILGFNILAFVTGLITLALIIFIIKLCIGGK